MKAVLYKVNQLLKCKQVYAYCCDSSNGLISLQQYPDSRLNLLPDSVYDAYQKSLLLDKKSPSLKKICTWNVQELWWHCYKGHKIDNIINYIVSSDSDVLCLQEVFESDLRNLIIRHPMIIKKYPYFLTGNLYNKFVLGENSGILILSSQPIIFKQFTPFPKTALPDTFASKGALYFTVGEINFIVTHLQSENTPLALEQLIFVLQASPFTKKTVLLGDLNIPDPFPVIRLPRNNLQHTHDSGRTLDHIIPLFSDLTMELGVDYINLKNTSDHWPVFATLN